MTGRRPSGGTTATGRAPHRIRSVLRVAARTAARAAVALVFGSVALTAPRAGAQTYTGDYLPPSVTDHAYLLSGTAPLDVAAPGVLANAKDPDGGGLRAMVVAPPAVGTLTLNDDGSFRYVPPAGFDGIVAFTYQATAAERPQELPGTLGIWRLDEPNNTDISVRDAARNMLTPPHDGTLVFGPTRVDDGRFGRAVRFSGARQMAFIAPTRIIGASPDLTIEAWVRWDGGSGTECVYCERELLGTNIFPVVAALQLINGQPAFTTFGSERITAVAPRPLPTGGWHHIAGVLQRGAGGKIYVDGVLAAADDRMGPPTGAFVSGGAGSTTLAGLNDGDYFRGTLDEVRVMSVAPPPGTGRLRTRSARRSAAAPDTTESERMWLRRPRQPVPPKWSAPRSCSAAAPPTRNQPSTLQTRYQCFGTWSQIGLTFSLE